MRKLTLRLTCYILFSLVLGFFYPASLMADDRTEPEDLSIYRIDGETSETYLRDHLQNLLELIDEQGYELRYRLSDQHPTVRLGWTGFPSDNAKEAQTISISDSHYDSPLPFEDRPLSISYNANKTDSDGALEILMTDMSDALGFEILDPEFPEPDFVEGFHSAYVLDDTDSEIRYLFMKSKSQSNSPPYVYLASQIYPLAYNELKGIEAIGGLADYLYANQKSIDSPHEIAAIVTVQEPNKDAINDHLITYRTTYTVGGISTISHSISFDPNVMDNEIHVTLTYLEEHLPDYIAGITDMIMEVREIGDTIELKGDDWTAKLSRHEGLTAFWLNYELGNDED